jgi:hypothetical protein
MRKQIVAKQKSLKLIQARDALASTYIFSSSASLSQLLRLLRRLLPLMLLHSLLLHFLLLHFLLLHLHFLLHLAPCSCADGVSRGVRSGSE